MKLDQVDRLPGGPQSFLTVTPSAIEEIKRIGAEKPEGLFRVRCEIEAKKTDIYYEWDDKFTAEDFIVDVADIEIVMDAVTIAYILDEYTLDFNNMRFQLAKNVRGPLRHQKP